MPTKIKHRNFRPRRSATTDDLGGPGDRPTNGKNAKDAEAAVRTQADCPKSRPLEEWMLEDLLTNLMHLCDREKYNFDELVGSAYTHHAAER